MNRTFQHVARARSSRSGYTLIEMLVSMGVLSMLMAAVGSALMVGNQQYFRHKAQHDAASRASLGLAQGLKMLADGTVVTVAQAHEMQYVRPKVGDDGCYVIAAPGGIGNTMTSLEFGDEIRIYLENNTVYLDNLDDDKPPLEMAEGVLGLSFLCDGVDPDVAAADPDIPDVAPEAVRTVTVTLTAADKPFHPEGVMTLTRTVRLRNHL